MSGAIIFPQVFQEYSPTCCSVSDSIATDLPIVKQIGERLPTRILSADNSWV